MSNFRLHMLILRYNRWFKQINIFVPIRKILIECIDLYVLVEMNLPIDLKDCN